MDFWTSHEPQCSSRRWRTYGTSFSTTSFWCEIISPIVSNVSLLEMQHPRFGFVNVLHSPLAISDVFCVVKNHLVIIIGFWFPNPERYKMLEITPPRILENVRSQRLTFHINRFSDRTEPDLLELAVNAVARILAMKKSTDFWGGLQKGQRHRMNQWNTKWMSEVS